MARSRRELSPQDLKLWRHVTRNVQAYRAVSDEPPAAELLHTPAPRASADVTPALPIMRVLPPLDVGRTHDLGHRQARRLKRGKLPVDARLDLHGLTLDRAHAALTEFIRRSHASGARLVVVITGKGSAGEGRIRSEAPHWLNAPALRSLVLAVTHAHHHDGGSGALYVLLKRRKATE